MPSCKDIDANMMDWLYGELDSTAEASFREHLDACASCRDQAASFQHIRDMARDLPRVEPPVAVSNILLHEAGKRVERVGLGARLSTWFAGWVRPVAAHPALAAVASIALIVTVGGTMYLRNGKQVAEPILPAPRVYEPATSGHEPDTPRNNQNEQRPGASPAGRDESTPASDAELRREYAVDLVSEADKSDLDRKTSQAQVRGRISTGSEKTLEPSLDIPEQDIREQGIREQGIRPPMSNAVSGADRLLQADAEDEDTGAEAQLAVAGSTRRDLAGDDDRSFAQPLGSVRTAAQDSAVAPNSPAAGPGVGSGAGGVAGGLVSDGISEEMAAGKLSKAPAPKREHTRANKKPARKSAQKRGKKKAAYRPADTRAPAPVSPKASAPVGYAQSRGKGRASSASSKSDKKDTNSAWAERQHGRLLNALRRKRCNEAAKIANDILDRDRAYYYRNVRKSKSLSSCQKYIARETSARARRRARRAQQKQSDQAAAAEAAEAEQAADN